MRVYINMALFEMKYALRYRANIIFDTLSKMLSFFAFFFLWKTIFSIKSGGFGYSFREMATYYLVTNIFFNNAPFCWDEFAWFVRSGGMLNFLTKPLNLYYLYYFRTFGSKWSHMSTDLLFATFLYAIIPQYLLLPHNIYLLFLSILFWIGGGIIYFSMSFFTQALSFWFEEVSGYTNLLYVLESFLSGALIPLNIIPYGRFFIYQPFTYVGYIPAQIFMDRLSYNEIILHFLIMGLWIIVFGSMSLFILKKGLKNYSAPGG